MRLCMQNSACARLLLHTKRLNVSHTVPLAHPFQTPMGKKRTKNWITPLNQGMVSQTTEKALPNARAKASETQTKSLQLKPFSIRGVKEDSYQIAFPYARLQPATERRKCTAGSYYVRQCVPELHTTC